MVPRREGKKQALRGTGPWLWTDPLSCCFPVGFVNSRHWRGPWRGAWAMLWGAHWGGGVCGGVSVFGGTGGGTEGQSARGQRAEGMHWVVLGGCVGVHQW